MYVWGGFSCTFHEGHAPLSGFSSSAINKRPFTCSRALLVISLFKMAPSAALKDLVALGTGMGDSPWGRPALEKLRSGRIVVLAAARPTLRNH